MLNNKQKQALDTIVSGEHEKIFITGKGGTGKSYSAAEIIKELLKNDSKLTVNAVTPSHKSKNVLADFFSKAKVKVKTQTIHKYLGYLINDDYEEDGEIILVDSKDKLTKASASSTSDILILDESSMIPDELFQEAMGTAHIIIALGDLNQLKVVNGKDPILSEFKVIKFTEQMRQKNNDSCLSKAINLYNDNVELKYNSEEQIERDFNFANNNDYTLSETKNSLIDDYCNKDIDVILCFTNATVGAYNEIIQKRLYDTDIPIAGNTMILQKPMFGFNIDTRKTMILKQNGSVIKVLDSKINEKDDLEIETEYFGSYTDIFGNTKFGLIKTKKIVLINNDNLWDLYISKYRGEIIYRDKFGKGRHLYAKSWTEFKSEIIYAKLPYAMTVHKAQGSSYDNVGVNILDIGIAKRFDVDSYNRLMYVALSRARESVKYVI